MAPEVRSHRGCKACRGRRRKCDETRPTCQACLRRGILCEYPQIRINVISSRNGLPRQRPTANRPKAPLREESSPSPPVAEHDFVVVSPRGSDRPQVQQALAEEWTLEDHHLPTLLRGLFQSSGENIAFLFYTNFLSGLLQAYDGGDNAYRRLAILAAGSPVLRDTVVSCATEYMHLSGCLPTALAVSRRQKAIQSIKQELDAVFDRETCGDLTICSHNRAEHVSRQTSLVMLLAAILLQVAATSFQGGQAAPHIDFAYHIFEELKYLHTPITGFIPQMVVQRFSMIEVVSSIFQRRPPRLPRDFWLFKQADDDGESGPSPLHMFGCSIQVMGFLASISRISSEIVSSGNDNTESLEEAFILESELRYYGHRLAMEHDPSGFDHDDSNCEDGDTASPSARDHGLILLRKVNLCFYWTAHLLVQRRVYRDTAESPRVQQVVTKIINLISSISPGCGVDTALPFPFYIMSREAIQPEDQDWIRRRHFESLGFFKNPARTAMFTLSETIWKRRSDHMGRWPPKNGLGFEDEVAKLEKDHGVIIF